MLVPKSQEEGGLSRSRTAVHGSYQSDHPRSHRPIRINSHLQSLQLTGNQQHGPANMPNHGIHLSRRHNNPPRSHRASILNCPVGARFIHFFYFKEPAGGKRGRDRPSPTSRCRKADRWPKRADRPAAATSTLGPVLAGRHRNTRRVPMESFRNASSISSPFPKLFLAQGHSSKGSRLGVFRCERLGVWLESE